MKNFWNLFMGLLLLAGVAGAGEPALSLEDTVLERYRTILLSEEPPSAETMQGYVDSLSEAGTWPDVIYVKTPGTRWKTSDHITRLRSMVLAFAIRDHAEQGAGELRAAIERALDHWLAKRYQSPNWWWTEIGTPRAMRDIVVLLGDGLTGERRKGAIEVIGQHKLKGGGANLIWSAELSLHHGCLTGDRTQMERAAEHIWAEVKTNGPVGIQRDGSFYQHKARLQTFHYGQAFLDLVCKTAWQLRGTPWSMPEAKQSILTNYILEGARWMCRGTYTVPGTLDRAVSRKESLRLADLRPLLRLWQDVDPEHRDELDAFIAAQERGEPAVEGYRHFPLSDFTAYHHPEGSVFLKTVSTRTYFTERGYENLKGVPYLNCGDHYILQDGLEYHDLQPVWQWKYLPGLTVSPAKLKQERKDFVGGLGNGQSGVTALDYERSNEAGASLSMRKAWFFHEDRILCLMGGIQAARVGDPIVTSLEQCRLRGPVTVRLNTDGVTTLEEGSHDFDHAQWILHNGIGYIPLNGAGIQLFMGEREGNWHSINRGLEEDSLQEPVLHILMEQGDSPASGGWIVVLGATSRKLDAMLKNPDWKVLQNDRDAQAIEFADGLRMASFYEPGTSGTEVKLAVDQPCLAMWSPERLWLCDPTMQGQTVSGQWQEAAYSAKLPVDGEGIEVAPVDSVDGDVARSPNVLVILVDDLGYSDLSCQGSTEIITPHIDALAASGIRFTDGYVTAPQCGPSRAGLISGVFQDRFGYNDIINQRGLPPKSMLLTLPEQMKAQGYVTGMAGKWHVGYKNPQFVHPPEEDNAPWNRGFDYVLMHDSGMSHYYNYSEAGAEWNLWRGIDNRYQLKLESAEDPHYIEQLDPDTYMTDYLTDQACAFIRRNKDKPWFFYLAYNAPHTPMVAKKEKLAKYDHLDGVRRVLAAMMDSLDEGVGKVVEEIRASGQAENTMIWFLSDNGGETPHNGSLNEPLAGRKGHLFEGGIRVPFIVAFPGTLPEGRVETGPISSLDILPTAMALAGAKSIPEIYDGHNVMPWLTGKTESPAKELFWSFWGNYALRAGDFKEVRSNSTNVKTADGRPVPGHFFSNIRENMGEDPDQPLQSPERRQMLANRLDQRLVQLKEDQRQLTPTFTPAFQEKIENRQQANREAQLLPRQWVRIDFEQIDEKARVAKDIMMPPGTHGYYSEGCRIAEGVSGKGLRFKNGQSMQIGKSAATSEMKAQSPVTTYFWVKLDAEPDELDTLLDMTDNTRPIEDSGFGYRLQVSTDRKLVFSLKSADGNVRIHRCEKLGPLPLGRWQFVSVRYGSENQITLNVLDASDLGADASVIAENSETVQATGKLALSRRMIPHMGSNADASGSFLDGTVDELGMVPGWVSDQALFEAARAVLRDF